MDIYLIIFIGLLVCLLALFIATFYDYVVTKIEIRKLAKERELERVKYEPYKITFGHRIMYVSPGLIASQKCEDNLGEIKRLHKIRLALVDFMEVLYDHEKYDMLRNVNDVYTELEFLLQDQWKFERNINFHRFWTRPGCTCPIMDNEDFYPHRSVKTASCKIHGEEVLNIKKKTKKVKKKVKKKSSQNK